MPSLVVMYPPAVCVGEAPKASVAFCPNTGGATQLVLVLHSVAAGVLPVKLFHTDVCACWRDTLGRQA